MGKDRTGVTTKEIPKISLSVLLQSGFIQSGAIVKSKYSWTDGNKIGIECHYTNKNQFIRLFYTVSGQHEKQYDYQIPLDFVPSNLGKGQVPYFICPEIGKRCRILYRAFGSHKWKCRDAYSKTIFYGSQVCSQFDKFNERYWRLDKQIQSLISGKRKQSHYKGKLTRRYKHLQELIIKQERANYLRWQPENLPESLNELIK